ncbi:MAG: hypothetical protein PHW18_11970 [Sulfuricurvum sp.]|nr:hypothetical protein [Sulfuricurvum sp.]MDD2830281.1 hypothetical protein [Sulfuricurvum sp.]
MLNECGEQKKVSDISMHSQRGRWERGKVSDISMHSQRGRWERGSI